MSPFSSIRPIPRARKLRRERQNPRRAEWGCEFESSTLARAAKSTWRSQRLRERPDALLVSPDPLYVVRRVQLATLAARHAIPTSFSNRDPVEAGGLVSYGPNITDAYRQ